MKWKEITFNGFVPAFRHGHRAVCDENTKTIYTFGGGDRKICKQFHIFKIINKINYLPKFNGRNCNGVANFGMELYNNKIIIIFGGMKEYGEFSNDLYTLDVKSFTWKKYASNSENVPTPRIGHSFTLTDDKRVILFGGLTNVNKKPTKANTPKYMNDLYVLHIIDEEKYRWEKLQTSEKGPCERESHTACFYSDKIENRKFLLVFGGMNGERLGDMWFLDLSQMIWMQFEISGLPPTPRSLHSATLIGTKMYIFGGWVEKSPKKPIIDSPVDRFETTNLLCYLNLEHMKWVHFEDYNEVCPSPRAGHSMVAFNTRLYLFSGRSDHRKDDNDNVCLKDFWYLETDLPKKVTNMSLVNATKHTLELKWDEIANAECYLVELHKIQSAPIDLSKIRIKGITTNVQKDEKKEEKSNTQMKRKLDDLMITNEKKLILDVKEESTVDENQNKIKIEEKPEKIETFSPPEKMEVTESPQKKESVDQPQKVEIRIASEQPKIFQADSQKSWLTVGIFNSNTCTVDGFYKFNIKTQDLNSNNCPNIKELKMINKIQLSSNTMFAFRVATINMMGVSEWSKMFYFKTAPEELPSTPNNCKFIPTPNNSLRLAWTPNNLSEKISSYAVFIASNKNKVNNDYVYLRVYQGKEPTCHIESKTLNAAYRERIDKKDHIIFQFVAMNNLGSSKALTIKYPLK